MGLRWGVVFFVMAVTVSTVRAQERSMRVEGYSFTTHGLAFSNYTHWSESPMPRWAELAHCTSLVLMARQMFHYATFAPHEQRLSAKETERLVRAVYAKSTALPPEDQERIVIPGFSSLREISAAPKYADIIRRVMGDSVFDALRPGWHWTPFDILRTDHDSNERMEQYLRDSLDRGRVTMLYLTRGTDYAHAVLVYGYDQVPGQRRFITYDPNRPTTPTTVYYNPTAREFFHPSLHGRDGWILHPYSDMAPPPYPGWL